MAIGFSIACALLAERRNRNPISWFFLSIFWGFSTILILLFSKRLKVTTSQIRRVETTKESDSLATTMWTITLIPVAIMIYFLYFIVQEIKF